jgi:hypothetical protein
MNRSKTKGTTTENADKAPSVKCPGCSLELHEDDLRGQFRHMKACHPEIVAERRAESDRWDGWEDE